MTFNFLRQIFIPLCIFTAGMGVFCSPANAIAASTSTLQWSSCPQSPLGLPSAGQQCAIVEVPLDYGNPQGKKISIAISRILAKPGLRHGVLLLNLGGPGNPGIDLPRQAAMLMPQSLLDRFDLIGFDPRFVGSSSPVSCGLSEQELLNTNPYPVTKSVRFWMFGCSKRMR